MNETVTLADLDSLRDLGTYVARAKRVDPEAIRLVAGGGVLAVYAPVIYARGLLDVGPTVLGLRTFAVDGAAVFDRTVIPASLSERIVRLADAEELTIPLPPSDVGAAWAGIAPPRGGWVPAGTVRSVDLEAAAREGATEIAGVLPDVAGDHVVHGVRAGVWGRPIAQDPRIPAGAAFGAESLGFLGQPEDVRVLTSGPWTRLTSHRGHVLVRVQ